MAEIIKNLKKWFVQWTGIVIAMFMWWALYVFASSLTAIDGETLTATKWNALVDKVNTIETTSTWYDYDSGWFDVWTTSAGYGWWTSDWTRNTYTKTHNLNSLNLDVKLLFRINSTDQKVYNVYEYDQYYSTSRACFWPVLNYVDSNAVKISVRYSWCSNHYVSSLAYSKTIWQYRVLIKKLP